jgi:hypothetical protein
MLDRRPAGRRDRRAGATAPPEPRPALRAARLSALGPLLVAVFARAYLLLSAADPTDFSEPLNRISGAATVAGDLRPSTGDHDLGSLDP